MSARNMLKLGRIFLNSPNIVSKAVQKLHSTPTGHRLAPPQSPANDAKFNFRLDKGDGNSIVLQANSNAADQTVKRWLKDAPNGSHTVIALVHAENKTEQQVLDEFLEAIRRLWD